MRLRELNGTHLSYCTNVHPGETWSEVHAALSTHVRDVKRRVAPNSAFGVGLRLAARATADLESPGVLERTRAELDEQDLYVFTLNGFPYGAFHGARVKERVYEPDWTQSERVEYTNSLARVLAKLLPDGERGSISTVPGCFKPHANERATQSIVQNLLRAVATLVGVERESGQFIQLALEPEPYCFLETSAETLAFFKEQIWTSEAFALLAKLCENDRPSAERALYRHLGVCLDTCHAAVEFESPLAVLQKFESAGIAVPKIQISAGLRVANADNESLAALDAFAEDVYLHQTVVRTERGLTRYLDLPDALEHAPRDGSEWRIHFHVPVFQPHLGKFASTQPELVPLLRALAGRAACPHLEVETYTWGVLPEAFRDVPVAEAIAHELTWTLSELGCQ